MNNSVILDKKLYSKKPVNTQRDAHEYISKMVLDHDREHFIVLNLNARSIPISVHIISIGTINANLVHPREVFYQSIKRKACSIIVAHNHPSGGLEPSEADIMLTNRLKDAGKILGIEVNDHLIMDRKGDYKSII